MGNEMIKPVYEKGSPLEDAVKSALQDTADCPELSADFAARVEAMVGRAHPAGHGRAFRIAASIAASVTLAGLVYAATTVAARIVSGEPEQTSDEGAFAHTRDAAHEDTGGTPSASSAEFPSASHGTSAPSVTSSSSTQGDKTMNIRKKAAAALATMALAATPASATPLTYAAGGTDLDGKVVITYDTADANKIATLVATPSGGETLTISGDAMTFAAGATISMAADGKLVFANDVASDGALSLDRTDGAYCDWTATKDGALSKGYCLRTTSQDIFAEKSLADWELINAFAYADAKPVRPITKNKVGNKPASTSSSDAHGTWSYSNIAGAYLPVRLLVTESGGSITRKEYVVNRWSGEYTYSARVWLDQSAGNIKGKIRTAVCGGQFARSPGEDLWRGISGSSNFWTGWYGDSATDHANPNYLGAPHYLAINRVVIRKIGSDVATVGFSGAVTLGGTTDVALGVKLAVLPKENSTFAAPVFSGEGDVEYQRNATLAKVNMMKYGSNLSVSNAQVTVTHSGAFPTNAVVDVWKDGVVLANATLSNVGGISDGWYDLNVRRGGAFRTQSNMLGGIGSYQLAEIDGGELYLGSPDATQAGDGTTSGNGRYVRLLTFMNGAMTKGRRIRVGYDANCPAYWHVCGTSPSTNDCEIGTLKGTGEFTIDVDDLADETPDFVCNGNIVAAGGTSQPTSFVKAGEGTMEMTGTISILSGHKVYVDGGTLLFGENGGFKSDSASKAVELRGGTLAKAGGALTCGTLTVGDAGGTLELASANATMTIADSSAAAWSESGTLYIRNFRDKAIRFGTSASALTEAQQRCIRREGGGRLHLDANGYLARHGMAVIIR